MSKQSAYFKIPGLAGKHDVKELKNNLAKIRGITSVSVQTETDQIAVDYDSTGTTPEEIGKRIHMLGMDARLIEKQAHIM